MKMPCKLLAAAALAAGPFAAPAGAAPITAPTSLKNAAAPEVEAVQWRRGWRGWAPGVVAGAIVGGAVAATQPWNYGYYGGPYDAYAYDPGYGYAPGYRYAPGYTYDPGYSYGPAYSYGPGAAYAYAPGPSYSAAPGPSYSAAPGPSYSAGGDESYCRQRFRSYDAASGTYLGYDGLRHSCP
jgi:BA14K-like protein